ncbi:MAG: hypothetical protein A2086_16705 [Spirochaetes bacterium GWD1_27_9]|nr:MAG: hypothetical protein A2Z98_00560 [Spirochaetes bacterium GWB1_27_13]OHD20944.1 MAG: hypothetical protein A2Y34_11975 [Spirochaetes bacterium GWC1_27_15]OHD31153.1 MAG: hypothetical protein A2086_16705 [Spirochaetes bacterium GWD1_27_9]
MILNHIEIQNDKVIIPIEEWDKIIAKLSKIEKVEIEEDETPILNKLSGILKNTTTLDEIKKQKVKDTYEIIY